MSNEGLRRILTTHEESYKKQLQDGSLAKRLNDIFQSTIAGVPRTPEYFEVADALGEALYALDLQSKRVEKLEAENAKAREHIDNLHVIMADQGEKLQRLRGFREGVVKALDYNPITAHLRADEDLLQEIAELEKLHHRIEAKIVSQPKPAPREGCIQYRIRERQKREIAIIAEAHQYMMNGPAGLRFKIQGTGDIIKVVKILLTASNLGKPLQVNIQEAVQ